MPSIVNWSVEVDVGGGPSVSAASSFLAEAYAVVEITADGGNSVTEAFQAAPVGELEFIFITATRYADADLEFVLGGETVALDQPQLYSGAGMLSRFAADVSDITVNNDLADSVTVSVLVGRAAS